MQTAQPINPHAVRAAALDLVMESHGNLLALATLGDAICTLKLAGAPDMALDLADGSEAALDRAMALTARFEALIREGCSLGSTLDFMMTEGWLDEPLKSLLSDED